jgi:hypothetical protein
MKFIIQIVIFWPLALPLHAVVVYHQELVQIGIIDHIAFPDEVNFDLNHDGIPDVKVRAFQQLNFGHFGTDILGSPENTEFVTEIVQSNTGRRTTLTALSIGESIGEPAQSFQAAFTMGGIISNYYSDSFPDPVQGPFANETAFLGLRFLNDGEFHYGYLHLRGEGATGATVFGYAWETEPGKAIAAGAIPEPSAPACVTIGLLAWILKRRR